MSMGYMGYVKFGGSVVLATSADVQEVVVPIYSGSVRGAGWYNAGTAHYADDVVRFEGNIDIDLRAGVMSFLSDWIVETRTTPKGIIISPDGLNIYTFTAGSAGGIVGAYNSSASFSSSEGALISASLGVLGLTRSESSGAASYQANKAGIAFSAGNPYAYWQSIVSIGGSSFSADTHALDWNFDVSNNPVVVYACTGARGPIAVLMGEIEATGSASMFCLTGVTSISVPVDPDSTSLTVTFGGHSLSLPRAYLESDGNPVNGGDTVINRVFNFKGLADTNPPFLMS
jgi:hypothetical protein